MSQRKEAAAGEKVALRAVPVVVSVGELRASHLDRDMGEAPHRTAMGVVRAQLSLRGFPLLVATPVGVTDPTFTGIRYTGPGITVAADLGLQGAGFRLVSGLYIGEVLLTGIMGIMAIMKYAHPPFARAKHISPRSRSTAQKTTPRGLEERNSMLKSVPRCGQIHPRLQITPRRPSTSLATPTLSSLF